MKIRMKLKLPSNFRMPDSRDVPWGHSFDDGNVNVRDCTRSMVFLVTKLKTCTPSS